MIFAKVLKAQADLGLDVVTDGEMERGAYYMQVKSLYAGPIEQSKYHTSFYHISHFKYVRLCEGNSSAGVLASFKALSKKLAQLSRTVFSSIKSSMLNCKQSETSFVLIKFKPVGRRCPRQSHS